MYNNCAIVDEIDDAMRCEIIQNKFDALRSKHEELCKQLKETHDKCVQLKDEYQSCNTLDHSLNVVIAELLNDKLDNKQYHELINAVLFKVTINEHWIRQRTVHRRLS